MNYERYYRFAGASPVLLPLAFAIPLLLLAFVASGLDSNDLLEPIQWAYAAAFYLGFSAIIAGLPYVLFVLPLFWWLRGRREFTYLVTAFLAPLFFSGFLWICLLLFETLHLAPDPAVDPRQPATFYSLHALGLGYAYVVIILLLRPIFVRPNETPTGTSASKPPAKPEA